MPRVEEAADPVSIEVLESIERRVLWLAVRMIDEANHVRPNPDGTKVGGHQASSASVATIVTALYFGGWLRPGDRVAIKPHASPAFHAAQYLLGTLERKYLGTLRQFGGLQAYPSRTKDPDPVDLSTGSVGLGVAATLFAALTDRYAETHFHPAPEAPHRRRFVALVGDAELDEGNVWEAISDESVRSSSLCNVTWIVDLNRQSLDRVIPGIKVREWQALFAGAGWQVLEAKYGRRLKAAFAGSGGVALRRRIDDMPNEEYQAFVRLPGAEARTRLVQGAPAGVREALARSVADVSDADLPGLLSDLGGHDLGELLRLLHVADEETTCPTVLFAYTMKGWGLPVAGDPLNHAALLTPAQVEALRVQLAVPEDDPWIAFSADSPEGQWCTAEGRRLFPAHQVSASVSAGEADHAAASAPASGQGVEHGAVSGSGAAGAHSSTSTNSGVHAHGYAASGWYVAAGHDAMLPVRPQDFPATLPTRIGAAASTQEAFGTALVELARLGGPVAERLVTTSPDVAVSTSLGGWLNRVGVWATEEAPDLPETGPRLLRWQPGPRGHHIELGISEMNLFLLLGQLGLSHELNGNLLLPVGTVYDPFVCRGLDALIYSTYQASKFVFAGTPSGVTLSPEGGAHQSSITPTIGMGLPNLTLYEPCFGREVEWCLLEGLQRCLDRQHGTSTYLRLSTKPIEQAPFEAALNRLGEAELRRQVLAGGYRLLEPSSDLVASGAPRVVLAASGAILPETLEAAVELQAEGLATSVLNLTSADRLYRGWQARQLALIRAARLPDQEDPIAHAGHLGLLLADEAERPAPLVTVLDGASHGLAWLGGVFGQRVVPLGVDRFGQSGARADLYSYAGVDPAHITSAAIAAVAAQAKASGG